MEKTWVEAAPQLLVNVAVAEQDAVGLTVCWLDVPEVPQPFQDQLPPDDGVGAKTTCAPELMLTFPVWVPLIKGVMTVGLQVPPPPEPVGPNEQYRGVSTLMAGNNEAEQAIGPVKVANTNVPDLPYATDRVPLNVHVDPSSAHFV
jgi:hypothetical protein